MSATAVKDRPILFSAPMVRAILAGRKTQTRRLVTTATSEIGSLPARDWSRLDFGHPSVSIDGVTREEDAHLFMPIVGCQYLHVPHRDVEGETMHDTRHRVYPRIMPGDRLWVRETWSLASGNGRRVVYRADLDTDRWPPNVLVPSDDAKVWKPSIHMKRADARTLLDVTELRVERLQEITEDDALAEGVAAVAPVDDLFTARLRFERLWDEINGDRAPWESNPWVWVVSFKQARVSR